MQNDKKNGIAFGTERGNPSEEVRKFAEKVFMKTLKMPVSKYDLVLEEHVENDPAMIQRIESAITQADKDFKMIQDTKNKDRVRWLIFHPVWNNPQYPGTGSDFHLLADFEFVYVNPETETIEDDDSLNTAFRIWVESGPYVQDHMDENVWCKGWDHRLDCGGPDMETVLLNLANLVEKYYNENGIEREGIDDDG